MPIVSPFYARSYGGFTPDQVAFIRAEVGTNTGLRIFDPMAGQATFLGQLAWEGNEVWTCDLNPALSVFASLRDPQLAADIDDASNFVAELLSKFPPQPKPARPEYVQHWLSDPVRAELQDYGRSVLGLLGLGINPVAPCDMPTRGRLAIGIPVLAARDLACFRTSDNAAWVKPGGLARQNGISLAAESALESWREFALSKMSSEPGGGQLCARVADVRTTLPDAIPMSDLIVTSPPYANRLDYSRMWAPELEVIAAMFGFDVRAVKAGEVGSTVIKGTTDRMSDENMAPAIAAALEAIRVETRSKASADYYFPFFRNYALRLTSALRNAVTRLRLGGRFVIFVRDTVRKDVLFPTGQLVDRVLTHEGLCSKVAEHRVIVRRHIGLRRLASTQGVYGLAQHEWWFVFQRNDL